MTSVLNQEPYQNAEHAKQAHGNQKDEDKMISV